MPGRGGLCSFRVVTPPRPLVDANRAAQLLRVLADGVDPITGDVVGPASPLQHPDVVRALYAGVEALGRTGEETVRPASRPGRAGRSWDAREDEDLVAQFEAGASAADLAASHQRSTGAVRARLVRLGTVEDRRDVR